MRKPELTAKDEQIAKEIREFRELAGYTQLEFAKKTNIGISTIRSIEQKTAVCSQKTYNKFLKFKNDYEISHNSYDYYKDLKNMATIQEFLYGRLKYASSRDIRYTNIAKAIEEILPVDLESEEKKKAYFNFLSESINVYSRICNKYRTFLETKESISFSCDITIFKHTCDFLVKEYLDNQKKNPPKL